MSPEETAEAYIQHYQTGDKKDSWAVREVDLLIETMPDEAWDLTCILIRKSSADDVLAFVAAGPLEELLVKHGPVLMARVEDECKRNDRLVLALSGVWLEAGTPVFERWYALMFKYGFAEGTRRGL
jgi:hypothetical protein